MSISQHFQVRVKAVAENDIDAFYKNGVDKRHDFVVVQRRQKCVAIDEVDFWFCRQLLDPSPLTFFTITDN